ncbi:MAG: hypothetical protein IJ971_02310 [Bacteroidales bacterium]|nr:hypothetical protein [Bacteroidales bacterium]
MRGRIMTLLCLWICCTSYGQVKKVALSVYTEPLKFLKKGSATIGFDYAFDDQWSTEGSASFPFAIGKGHDSEEADHESGLSGHKSTGVEGLSSSHNEYRMGICYWPQKHNDGSFMKICCTCSTGKGADLLLGVGYAISIWKGSGISFGYEMGLLSIARNDTYSNSDINIRLFYRF